MWCGAEICNPAASLLQAKPLRVYLNSAVGLLFPSMNHSLSRLTLLELFVTDLRGYDCASTFPESFLWWNFSLGKPPTRQSLSNSSARHALPKE